LRRSCRSFNIRYLTALSDPIVKALRVLDTSTVYKQQDNVELDAHGNDDISLMVENYCVFFRRHNWCQGSCTVEADEANAIDCVRSVAVEHRGRTVTCQ
jgi:hypothetical protein